MQQRLLAAEEAASRDTRKMDTLARDVKAEQQHAAATLERLERAHLRIQQLESQVRHSSPGPSSCSLLPFGQLMCPCKILTRQYWCMSLLLRMAAFTTEVRVPWTQFVEMCF